MALHGHFPKYSLSEGVMFHQILDTMRQAFADFGFIPHTTPMMLPAELVESQTGIQPFKVVDPNGELTDVVLRTDHTVGLLDFIKHNREQLAFPFKRYVSLPVFRPGLAGDWVQVHASDVDVIGRNQLSLAYDAEILCLLAHTLTQLGLNPADGPLFCIQINHRQLINGFLDQLGLSVEQVGRVRQALGQGAGDDFQTLLGAEKGHALEQFMAIKGSCHEVLAELDALAANDAMREGIDALRASVTNTEKLGFDAGLLQITPTLTRRMAYYTGLTCRALINLPDGTRVAVSHGGRYQDCTADEVFHGVGVTLNVTQLFDLMLKQELLPTRSATTAPVMVSAIGSVEHAMFIAQHLRSKGVSVELLLEDNITLAKQREYARRRGFKLFLWTEDNTHRNLQADDIIKMDDYRMPGDQPQSWVCSGLFEHVRLTLLGSGVWQSIQ